MQQRPEHPRVRSEERVEFPSRRGNRLVGLFQEGQGPRSPAVILCHGMESTKDGTKHTRLAGELAARGIASLRFDFSYVGESEGEFADLTFRGEVEDLGGAWDFVTGRMSGPVGLIGSSMGGAVALLFASDEPRVRTVVTIAAVGHPKRILEEIRPDEVRRWREEGHFRLAGVELRKSFLEDVETIDVLDACRSVRCPVFVAHGEEDQVVPVGDGEEIADVLGGEARFRRYPEADHRFSRPEHLDELLRDCLDWVEEHLRNGSG